jgi:hypothetical protein
MAPVISGAERLTGGLQGSHRASMVEQVLRWISPSLQATLPMRLLRRFQAWASAKSITAPGAVATVAARNIAAPGAVARVSPQENALSRIEELWREQATTEKRRLPASVDARVLACQFRSCLQSEPALIGQGVSASWVQSTYPLFCRALHVVPLPFKDFASELKAMMPKKRKSRWKGGERVGVTRRYYLVSDPASNVVDLAERREAS